MSIVLWPVVGRAQLVRAFRPGESGAKEAPFRTLRQHGWATGGVSVPLREGERASGRFVLFSVFNVDAARCARQGDEEGATRFAGLAARIEASPGFLELGRWLRKRTFADVSRTVDGFIEEASAPDVQARLRQVALDTEQAREKAPRTPGLLLGKVLEVQPDYLTLRDDAGRLVAIPRPLAHAVHRERVDDCLALLTDQIDEHQFVVQAVPAMELTASPASTFSPFGRAAPVRALSGEDVTILSKKPKKLKITVPVTLGS